MVLLTSNINTDKQSKSARAPTSFRRQLFIIFSVGTIVFALMVSFIFAWLSSRQIENLYVQEGLQATENFANDAELALLYESGENADDAANAVLSFPSISRVYLINGQNKILLQKGTAKVHPSITADEVSTFTEAQIISENQYSWVYAAPVFTSKHDDEHIAGEETILSPIKREFLGYAIIVQAKNQLRNIQVSTFIKHLFVGLLYGAIVILFLHLALKQLLRPMDTFSQAMQETSKGNIHKIDRLEGPLEIQQMIRVYNSMLDTIEDRDKQLRSQNDQLESLVEKRTQELVLARDEALDASKQKSIFLANVSHELRTPLQSIIGYSDIIQELLEDEGLEEFNGDIDRINYNATHLLTMINSILDLSKIESGNTKLNFNETDIDNLLTQAESVVAPIIAKNGNKLAINRKNLDRKIIVDSQKLLQIIINLLSNAGKFTENGNILLSAELTPHLLSITVKDSGIGIEKSVQELIFTPFRQADDSFTKKFQGTGLGLSICKYFCELMGGKIVLESELGEGSSFAIYIPLPITQDQQK